LFTRCVIDDKTCDCESRPICAYVDPLRKPAAHAGAFGGSGAAMPAMTDNPKDIEGRKKVPLGLLPAAGKIAGALACQYGAGKYGPYNWRDQAISYSVYLDAIERHLLALRDGEDAAPDSKVHHLGHIIAGAAIALDAIAVGKMKDDRPKRPAE
jgi:hypothetical protein